MDNMTTQIDSLKLKVKALYGLVIALIVLGVGAWMAIPEAEAGRPNIVYARKFILVDRRGERVAILGSEGGVVALVMQRGDNKPTMVIGTGQGETGISILDGQNRTRVAVAYDEKQDVGAAIIKNQSGQLEWFAPNNP